MPRSTPILTATLILGISACAEAATIHVPAEQPTIQAGINAAVNGDTVLVAAGTYNEFIKFNGKAITVESEESAKATIIDATGLNASVVSFVNNEGNASVLRGFRITGGKGTIVDTIFRHGGGIHVLNSSPTVEQCEIVANSCSAPTSPGGASGGGIGCTAGNMILRNCLIKDNSVSGSPNGSGGGMRATGNELVVGCTFLGNLAGGALAGTGGGTGGGVRSNNGTFINCTFAENSAGGPAPGGGGAYGGNLYINCTFVDNLTSACCTGPTLTANGAGIIASSATTLINCTVANNNDQNGLVPPTAGVALMSTGSAPVLKNCIVFGNEGIQVGATAIVSHSLVQGGFAGEGNIDGNPMFIDSSTGDYRLASGSSSIDIGDLDSLPADLYDLDEDGNTKEYVSLDLGGERRVVNGLLDMGAYEWQRTCVADISPSSPGIAGNGTIDGDDLLIIINGWGTCDGCVGDVNGDNAVDVDDLLAIINGWGACK